MSREAELSEIQRRLQAVRVLADDPRKKSVGPVAPDIPANEVGQLLARGKAIYGEDSRAEPAGDVALAPGVSDPVACLVLGANLRPKGRGFRFEAQDFGPKYQLCVGQRFHDQPCVGYGTGFLVASDVLVTAGHCVQGIDQDDIHVIFGFEVGPGGLRTERALDEIYRVKSAVFEVNGVTGADWAIVTLDRPIIGIAPLTVRTTTVERGEDVYVIGHPVGLPKKVGRGAKVTRSDKPAYFVTNLNTFGGNSGSPVFDAEHQVCGILVRGAEDFVWQGNCRVATTFPLLQGGEDVCRATVWIDKYAKAKLQKLDEARVDPSTGPDSDSLRLALRAFLLKAFGTVELKSLCAYNTLLKPLRETVHFDRALAEVVDDVIAKLFKERLIGDELFDILSRERPRRKDEIDRIRVLWR